MAVADVADLKIRFFADMGEVVNSLKTISDTLNNVAQKQSEVVEDTFDDEVEMVDKVTKSFKDKWGDAFRVLKDKANDFHRNINEFGSAFEGAYSGIQGMMDRLRKMQAIEFIVKLNTDINLSPADTERVRRELRKIERVFGADMSEEFVKTMRSTGDVNRSLSMAGFGAYMQGRGISNEAVRQALSGNIEQLYREFPRLRSQFQDTAGVVKWLEGEFERFGRAMAGYGDTAKSNLDKFDEAVEELSEVFSKGVLQNESFIKAVKLATTQVEKFSRWLDSNAEYLENYGGKIAVAIVSIMGFVGAVNTISKTVVALNAVVTLTSSVVGLLHKMIGATTMSLGAFNKSLHASTGSSLLGSAGNLIKSPIGKGGLAVGGVYAIYKAMEFFHNDTQRTVQRIAGVTEEEKKVESDHQLEAINRSVAQTNKILDELKKNNPVQMDFKQLVDDFKQMAIEQVDIRALTSGANVFSQSFAQEIAYRAQEALNARNRSTDAMPWLGKAVRNATDAPFYNYGRLGGERTIDDLYDQLKEGNRISKDNLQLQKNGRMQYFIQPTDFMTGWGGESKSSLASFGNTIWSL